MKARDKRILQLEIEHGQTDIKDVPDDTLKALKVDFEPNVYEPKLVFMERIRFEERRREIDRASKPIRMRDRNFFK